MNLTEIETPDLLKLIGYLEAVSDSIRTGELKWYFDVRLFECEGPFSDIKVLIKAAYPESNPETAEITEGSIHDLAETLRHELGRRLEPIEGLRLLTPVTELRGEMWQYLKECIDYEQSRIFEYTTTDGLDTFCSGGTVGNFAAVILNENQKRCLMLSGGDCD